MLNQGSHKERPEEKNDDDDEDDNVDDALIQRKQMGSLETRKQEKQTPIATPLRSPKIDLYSDKAPTTELTDTNVHMSDVPSRSSFQRAKHLRGVVTRVTRRKNRVIRTMKKSFVHRRDMENLRVKIVESLDKEVPPIVVKRIDQLVKANLRRMVQEEMQKETKSTHAITLQPPARFPIHALQEQLYTSMKDSPQAQVVDFNVGYTQG
ncbi:hypothetical protein Tco_0177014 [Tanacetum coccineum]